jgi:alkanesulfonate monooxygenase SsuD/methylene tetrahydromethanopterin reductase-like flavin-dependent oxidoreductase (luciferase family)
VKFHLAVALDGAGWHPAAWREPDARPHELLTGRYWADQLRRAEKGRVDFATVDDSMAIQSVRRGIYDDRVDQVRGRLDAVMVAARIAPTTSAIGLIPVTTTTHTEPFHISKAIATLDYVSSGRAGLQARISSTPLEAQLFGRRSLAAPGSDGQASQVRGETTADLFAEAADFIEVVRRLWDSWEDDAEIRHIASGRFVDRDKLHYIDFEGRWFSVRGPSITPRPPQGQPIVAVLAHVPVAFQLAATSADVVFVTPRSIDEVHALVAEVRSHEQAVGRAAEPLRIFADIVVFLDETEAAARSRRSRLDELDGKTYRSDALVFEGTPAGLRDLVIEWKGAGIDGVRLRPGATPHDLARIADDVADLLSAAGITAGQYADGTLRHRLGLPRPKNRYAA